MNAADVRLSACIMYAAFDPVRCEATEKLIDAIGREEIAREWHSFHAFGDPARNGIWWNSKRCWEYGLASGSTHHLVMQDDIEVCRDFASGVKEVIAARPDDMLGLFYGPRKGFAAKRRWGEAEGPWGQAVVMPTAMIKDFLDWEVRTIAPGLKYDDSRFTMYLIDRGLTSKIPFPNLVDHRDDEIKSTVGNNRGGTRMSIDFMGDRSPHDFDWRDPEKPMRAVNSYTRYNHFRI